MGYLQQAQAQHGLITRSQLVGDGMSRHQIARLLAGGRLEPLHAGVYRVGGAPDSATQAVAAAVLAASASMASHRSAGEIRGIGNVRAIGPEITVPAPSRPRLRGVIIHRTSAVDAVDIGEVDGIAVTTIPRTVLDLGAVLPPYAVESAMEDAVLRMGTQFADLRDCLDRLAAQGRNGCGVLRALLDARDPDMAAPASELELRFDRLFRRHGVPRAERQFWVKAPNGRAVSLDFAWPRVRLGLEVDGRVWHAGRLDVQRNTEKHNLLTSLGWAVLHYTALDLRTRPEAIVSELLRFLARLQRQSG